jgi:hypothetical protein
MVVMLEKGDLKLLPDRSIFMTGGQWATSIKKLH